jgi:PTH1 family peptidyl-tRNA hydrolase
MLVDRVCLEFGIKIGKVQSKALIGSGQIHGQKVILAKPQTYMNLSGQSISGLVRFYKIPLTNVLLAHDDLDLPLGTLRMRPSGGSAGQKGVASTIEQLGTPDFARLRIGIGRPPGQMDSAAYVLQNFTKQEKEVLELTLDRALKAAQLFFERGLETAMNQYNGGLKEG